MSTEYLGKSCRTAGWVTFTNETKVSSRGQSTTVMQRKTRKPIPHDYLIR